MEAAPTLLEAQLNEVELVNTQQNSLRKNGWRLRGLNGWMRLIYTKEMATDLGLQGGDWVEVR